MGTLSASETLKTSSGVIDYREQKVEKQRNFILIKCLSLSLR